MNLKRWFPWLCFGLMLVAEGFLFHANHQRDLALSDLTATKAQLTQVQSDLDDLKNVNPSAQALEINRLRKLNEILTNKVTALQSSLDQLRRDDQQNAQHLTTARTAIELQQEHLQQLQDEKQQATETENANVCIDNLRQIDMAKQQWALDKNKDDTSVPTVQDLLPYLKDGLFPTCPDGGTYTINSMAYEPQCSISGHVLPPPPPPPSPTAPATQ